MTNRRFGKSQDDLKIADQGWRTALLLFRLLEADGRSEPAIRLLTEKAKDWIQAEKVETRLVGLNLLRFLCKAKLVERSTELLDEISAIFFDGRRSDVRLAALDLLAAMGASPNPVERIPPHEAADMREFNSRMLKALNASQYSYSANGVRVDVERCVAGRTADAAMHEIIERLEAN